MSARQNTNQNRDKSELGAALGQAEKAPHKDEHWTRLEDLAAAEQRPDEVAELYRHVLRETTQPELVGSLGQRAVRFHEEWFGGKAEELVEILTRVLEVDPGAEWALRRLSVLYTVKERWSDLLGTYDQVLAAEGDVARRREILAEAVRVAKDFVGDVDRTVGYLRELTRLAPHDGNLFAQLERLLERQGRHADIAKLLQERMRALGAGAPEARRLREKTAGIFFEKLDDPAAALAEIAPVLAGGQDDDRATAIADRILRSKTAPLDVRRQALELIRARFEASGESEPIIEALEVALEFSDPAEKIAVQRELATRLATSGDRKGAIAALVVLLGLEPGATDAAEQLRHLAELEGDPRAYLRGLDAAAAAATEAPRKIELWLEAARIADESLGDPPAAVPYYRRILREPAASAGDRMLASRKLAALLAHHPDAVESPEERLAVLERLSDDLSVVAPRSAERRAALAEVAALAEAGGEVERAAAALSKLLELGATDPAALDGLIALYERTQRWEPLVTALRRRAAAAATPAIRRADLVRIAGVEAAELGQTGAAIETWLEIEKAFGEDVETTTALGALYTAAGKSRELGELLARAAERDGARLADTLARLGDVCRDRLGDPARAALHFARALEVDPAHPQARAGAQALLDLESCRGVAAEALARAAEATGDWARTVALLEPRLAGATDDARRVRLLVEAAALLERKGEDPAGALALYARALPLAPEDGAIERDLVRLSASNPKLVADTLRAAAGASKDPARAARLRYAEGNLREGTLADLPAALEAFSAAFAREPGRLELREAVVRTAARNGRWQLAAETALAAGLARETLERSFLPLLESLAAEGRAWDKLSEAAAAVLAGHEGPSEPGLARDLEVRLVRWCEAAGGEAPDAAIADRAEQALARAALFARNLRDAGAGAATAARAGAAVSSEALAASEIGILRKLAGSLRRKPSRALCETLVQIADLQPTDLDPLREAATIALGPLGAEPLAGTVLARLLDQATRLLRTGQAATGAEPAEKAAAWAVDEIVRLELSRPDRSAWARAVDLLLDATRLPLGRPAVRALRARAAELAMERLKDRRLAINVLRQMVEEDAQDVEATSRLGVLYQEERRMPELYVLRQEELARTLEVDRRLALRLELEQISGALEERAGRLEVLRANLEEQPGHRATIDTLARLLQSRNRHFELYEVLTDQATRLEERGDKGAAAGLWDWAARIVEDPLGDRDRAIRAHERVAELAPRPETFEALGRLYLEKGEPVPAADWLERRLEAVTATSAEPAVQIRAALELAGAYGQAGNGGRAVECLERALGEHPRALTVRGKLIELYRKGAAWQPLVRALNEGARLTDDKETALAWAREAAEISEERLGAPAGALAALERAAELAPEEPGLRLRLGDALIAAGRLDRARAIFEGLIKESGRRRSRERAGLHLRLAQVARGEGRRDEALTHLEQAAEMDVDSPVVLQAIAEVAAEAGDLDRAERAYRALVLLIERGAKGATLLATEALLRLRSIALGRGQTEKAQDLLESAITDAIGSPEEAARLGRALRAEGSWDVLRVVLERRLSATSEPEPQAAILAELGEVAEHEGRLGDAENALFSAVEKAPGDATTRATARRLARQSGSSARFVDLLVGLAEHQRRAPDAELGAALLTEAAEIALDDVGDANRTADLLGRAVQYGNDGGMPAVRAAYTLVRLAESRQAPADRARAVKSLVRLGGEIRPGMEKDASVTPARIEALFRLAEVQMGSDETRDQALLALSAALELSDDVERAFAIVRNAQVPNSDLPRVLPLYERVARASKDKRMLLDFLERRAALPGATPENVREGVELALGQGELGRAEALLVRAAELARGDGAHRKIYGWALLELAELRKNRGDIAGAAAALEEAREVADPVRVLRLYQEIAQKAEAKGSDPAVAARVYERLWEREPTERRFWEPLIGFYARLEDRANVERVARATSERLFDPAERNAVRLAAARFLVGSRTAGAADPTLIEILNAVLADDPTHKEAIELLADVYLSTGNEAGLAELLGREIEAARIRGDVPAVVALSQRLGARLVARDAAGEARDVYRRALESAPTDVGLLRALVGLLSPQEDAAERATLLERLLESESGIEAGRLGIELADLWQALGDEERVRRTLEIGVARAGGDPAIFHRLVSFYRERHALDRLAGLLVEEVDRRGDVGEKAALLREAAGLYRNHLARPREAATLLRRARALAPHDSALLSDLVGVLDSIGEQAAAIAELGAALADVPEPGAQRISILEARADLAERSEDFAAAVADRDEAHRIGGAALRPALRASLDRWRGHAAQRGDAVAEREAVVRLTELLDQDGDEEAARGVIAEWCYRHPEDAESLRRLVARDKAAERWEAVVESSYRLVEVEEGAAQVAAAQLLCEASERVGPSAPAIAGLEVLLQAQPGEPWAFEKLMALYEATGERRKQAALLMWASERNPDPNTRYQVLRRAGEVFLKERDLDQAAAAFARAMELKPGDRELSLLVADVYIAGGKLVEAEGILEEHMRRAAKDLSSAELSGLQHRMAQLAEARGDQAGRLEWLRRAFDTNRKNGVVAVELADLAEAANDLDLAVKALRAVTLLPPVTSRLTPAMAFLRQARIAFRTNDRPRAVIFAKRALQEDPRLGDAVEFLREIGERKA